MADTKAIAVFESVYRRTDQQIRDILATYSPDAEVDTINVLIGDGANVLVPGIAAALRVDFRSRITGGFIHEFDGTSGSVVLAIDKAQYATGTLTPSFVRIDGFTPLQMVSSRYGEDTILPGWDAGLERGDVLRFAVTSATSIKRILVALRIRRLEP